MKTIADLNSKWWYRLVKVVYIFLLFSWIIGTAIGIFFIFEPTYDNENSYIACDSGPNYKLGENGIYLYSEYMNLYDKEKAQNLCPTPVKLSAAEYEEKYGKPVPSFYDKFKPIAKYELVSVYTERDWVATIGFILLGIFSWLLFFEIVRRVFYYVVLGRLIPKKNA